MLCVREDEDRKLEGSATMMLHNCWRQHRACKQELDVPVHYRAHRALCVAVFTVPGHSVVHTGPTT